MTKPTTLTTGQVRLSYVHLTKPYAMNPGQEPKYSVTILIPKSDVHTKQRIDAAIEAAIQDGVLSKWGGVRPALLKSPVHDGDGERLNGGPFSAECKGHWVLAASSKQPVEVVDINLNPILDQTQIYSGMYGRVSINFFAFNANGNRGIGCGLNAVQKVADGEPLGGRISAAQAFGDGFTPTAPSTAAKPAFDPITGQPLSGGVMGL